MCSCRNQEFVCGAQRLHHLRTHLLLAWWRSWRCRMERRTEMETAEERVKKWVRSARPRRAQTSKTPHQTLNSHLCVHTHHIGFKSVYSVYMLWWFYFQNTSNWPCISSSQLWNYLWGDLSIKFKIKHILWWCHYLAKEKILAKNSS